MLILWFIFIYEIVTPNHPHIKHISSVLYSSIVSLVAFKWFDGSIGDLESDTQQNLFTKRVLQVEPVLLDMVGYHCIRSFFETINLAERKLRKLH